MFNLDNFLSMLGKNRMTKKQLAKALDISETSLYRRINGSGNFSVEEVRQMIALFGREEVLNCLFY